MNLPARGTKAPKIKGLTNFQFLNPGGSEIYEVGTKIQVIWTGGTDLPQSVWVALVNIRAWTVVNLPVTVTNPINSSPGICEVTIPHNFYQAYVASGKMYPTDTFLFYITDALTTTWTYGPAFTIWSGAIDQ